MEILTAIIIPCFNLCKQRQAILLSCLDKLDLQAEKSNIYLIELVTPNSLSLETKTLGDNVSHIKIYGEELNEGIWQKEALCNLSLKYLKNEEYLIFMDGDLYTTDSLWISKVKKKLSGKANVVLQPYFNIVDSKTILRSFCSIASSYKGAKSKYKPFGAGSIWAFRKSTFIDVEGFNCSYPCGSGDTSFLMEFLPSSSPYFPSSFNNYNWFRSLCRKQKLDYDLDYIECDFVHVNHGDERFYIDRSSYLNMFVKKLDSYYILNEQGLLEWNRGDNPLREVAKCLLSKLRSQFTNIRFEDILKLKSEGEIHLIKNSAVSLSERCNISSEVDNLICLDSKEDGFRVKIFNSPTKDGRLFLNFLSKSEVSFSTNVWIEEEVYKDDYISLLEKTTMREVLAYDKISKNNLKEDQVWRVSFWNNGIKDFSINVLSY